MRPTGWGRLCLVAFAGLLLSHVASGQTKGGIRGLVGDASGGVIPGATVTATMAGTSAERTVTTGGDGSFDIPELAVGTYSVGAEAPGFKKFVTNNVEVTIGHVVNLTLTLQVGGATETVTVQAAAVQVETTSTQLGAVMTSSSIRALPLNTRNAYALLQLQPGVQSQLGADLFAGSNDPGVVSVNGGRGRSNNYMVNGGDGNDIFVNGPAIQPSPDAIEEFRVLTNTFDAEYGRNSGSVVNVVTKSGTNQVHGDMYEFLRNNVLNTQGYFDPSVAKYIQNQFGATLGGPIKKDKSFIFGSYEGNRVVQGISSGTVQLPSAAEAGGDFSAGTPFAGAVVDQNFADVLNTRNAGACATAIGAPVTVNQTYQQIFPGNKIPTSCFDPTSLALYNKFVAPFGTDTISTVPHKNQTENQFTARFDQKLTPAQQLSVYYYFNNNAATEPFSTFQAAGSNLPGFGSLFGTRIQQWNISHTWTLGSTAVNEFRFSYFREGQATMDHPVNVLASIQDSCAGTPVSADMCFTDPTNTAAGITTNIPGHMGVPYINVSGGFTIGNNFEGELPQTGNTFQWMDNFTKTIGTHTIKFGGDVRRQQFNQFLYFEINGNYSFTNVNNADQVGSDDAYPNYFLGAVNAYQQGSAQGENIRNTSLYLFAQDSWKVKSNVTLSYGLRWELNTPYIDVGGNRLQTFRPGQVTTQYPCWLSTDNAAALGLTPGDCGVNSASNAVFPTGMVFPRDPGVQQGLTSTYWKSFAPRIGVNWSPGWTDGTIAKITGGPGKTSIHAGFGIFYNPIEQLVLEQFSAEPPFGGSTFLSNTLFNLPFEFQSGGNAPNPFVGVIHQTPTSPCNVDAGPNNAGPPGCVDWSTFRPILLFGEFQPNLRSQYSEQYNLTIERQVSQSMVLKVGYVGTQAHRLLATRDLNAGNIQTCLGLINMATADPTSVLSSPGGAPTSCGAFGADSEYFIPPTAVIPAGVSTMPTQPFKVPSSNCTGLVLPSNATSIGNCVPAGLVSNTAPNGIILVGTRPYSSPNCQPLSGSNLTGCPSDAVPVFSNIFAEDTVASSNYNALQVSLDRNYSHGLAFQMSYTFSKAIDQGASVENILNPLNPNATRGLSLLDAKNRFVFSPVWDLPVPQYSGAKGKFLDGWGVSAIIVYQSGFPIRIQDENDSELQSSFDFEAANTPTATGPIKFLNPKTNGGQWFDTSVFQDSTQANPNLPPTPAGQFGNTPHALCCGPALSNTDLVISKKTSINERWSTEFRAEFYNTWNHTQFANPDGNITDSLPPNGTFGVIQKTREGPRVIQFGLKVYF